MTQKFTAEEVRAEAAEISDYGGTQAGLMLAAYADTLSKPADSGRVTDDERQWRELLAIRVAGPMLYTDDGELSDTTTEPCIDFLRDSADTIACKLADRARAALAAQGQGENAHPDDAAVDAFAAAMKAKLAAARAKGRGGWQDRSDCSQQRLSDMLRAHVVKGDPRDVANFCMFLHQRGEGILPASPAGVPEGWKLAPILPSPLMVGEGAWAARQVDATAADIWAAMLAAAPSAPDGDGGAG